MENHIIETLLNSPPTSPRTGKQACVRAAKAKKDLSERGEEEEEEEEKGKRGGRLFMWNKDEMGGYEKRMRRVSPFPPLPFSLKCWAVAAGLNLLQFLITASKKRREGRPSRLLTSSPRERY